jgi:hypothetical protein
VGRLLRVPQGSTGPNPAPAPLRAVQTGGRHIRVYGRHRRPASGSLFCFREDQFPITIQGHNDSRPSWLASASTPDLPVTDLVVGRVPRNEKAPATWTVLELKSNPPSAFGRAGVVACPTPLAPLPIFSAEAWPHGALRMASGSFCRLTDGCRPVSFRQVRTWPSHTLGSPMGQSAPPSLAAGVEELASIPDAGASLLAQL